MDRLADADVLNAVRKLRRRDSVRKPKSRPLSVTGLHSNRNGNNTSKACLPQSLRIPSDFGLITNRNIRVKDSLALSNITVLKCMIQKKRAERSNNYFSSVFKIDNGEPSHEDYLLSDFDGDALSNISISPADVKETSGTSES